MCKYTSLIDHETAYSRYNIRVATYLGLKAAVYLDRIITIDTKSERKNRKEIYNGYFKLDRKFIESVTTLTVSEQKEIDKILIQRAIIQKPKEDANGDYIFFDETAYIKFMLSSDAELEAQKVVQKAKPVAKEVKLQKICEKLKNQIDHSKFEVPVIESLHKWIDTIVIEVHDSRMNSTTVARAQEFLLSHGNKNSDAMSQIVNAATASSHLEMQYAYENYLKLNGLKEIPAPSAKTLIQQSNSSDVPRMNNVTFDPSEDF